MEWSYDHVHVTYFPKDRWAALMSSFTNWLFPRQLTSSSMLSDFLAYPLDHSALAISDCISDTAF